MGITIIALDDVVPYPTAGDARPAAVSGPDRELGVTEAQAAGIGRPKALDIEAQAAGIDRPEALDKVDVKLGFTAHRE